MGTHSKRSNDCHGNHKVEQNARASKHAEDLNEGDIREHIGEERRRRRQ